MGVSALETNNRISQGPKHQLDLARNALTEKHWKDSVMQEYGFDMVWLKMRQYPKSIQIHSNPSKSIVIFPTSQLMVCYGYQMGTGHFLGRKFPPTEAVTRMASARAPWCVRLLAVVVMARGTGAPRVRPAANRPWDNFFPRRAAESWCLKEWRTQEVMDKIIRMI